ncbi:MAG TPA: hypothetical protein VF169_18895 [Albitalea sp.]|uniref:hypothetical protein n=1 Tax=Piscinibacter sp. TaxID=1903157 RepID=UPI002ED42330
MNSIHLAERLIAAALFWARGALARDTERALHAATDHADLKRLIDSQRDATPWWPGSARRHD